MATLMQTFDPNMYDPTQGVGGLPVGRHPVIIERDEVKANRANDGGYLQFDLRIIDGPLQGTTGAYRLNLYHNNPQTVEIANRQLSALCHVTGQFRLGQNGNDTSVLHNIPFMVEVAPQKNDPQYTEVKKVMDRNGNEPTKGGQGQGHAQPQGQGQQQQPQGQGQGGGWGSGQQQQPQQQPQSNGGGWQGAQGGQQQPQQQPQGAGNGSGTSWGQQQPQQQPQQPQQQPQSGGWQQGGGQQQPQSNGGQPSWGR